MRNRTGRYNTPATTPRRIRNAVSVQRARSAGS